MTALRHNGTPSSLASRLAVVLAVIAAFLFVASASASTRTFSPVALDNSVAVFKPRGLDPATVAAAKLTLGGKSYRLSRPAVRNGIRLGALRVPVPHGRASVRRAVRLRVTLRSRWSGQTSRPTRKLETSPAPTSSEPAPTSSEPAPTPTPTESEPTPTPSTPEGEASQPVSSVEIPADARYVSPTGSDSDSGSASSPWRTLSKAVSTASAGDVVVLEPGTYGAMGTTTNFSRSGSASAPIVFTSAPGKERAVIRGYVRVTASHLRLDSFVFDGPTGTIVATSSSNPNGEEVQVSIMGATDVELAHSEIRENAWHAGVFVSKATNVRIVSNYVHDNGDAATGANLDHGIYWCSGSGTVAHNTIEDNVAYGIQLYPTATNVLVSHNTIQGNHRGGIIVSRESAGNELVGNLVADNYEYGIRSYELSGSGNVARDNLLWGNKQNTYGSGISFSGTVVSDPDLMTASARSAYGA